MADEYVRHKQFEEYKQSLDRRFQDHTARAEGLHNSVKELRSVVTPLLFLDEKVRDLVKDFKELPTHEDLNYQTQTLSTRLDSLQAGLLEQKAQDEKVVARRTATTRWLIGVSITIGLPIAMAVFKKLGLFQ